MDPMDQLIGRRTGLVEPLQMLVLFLAVSVKLLPVLDQLFQRVLQHFLDDRWPVEERQDASTLC